MKILILANKDSGLYKFRADLIRELLKEHEVVVSVPNGEFVDELVKLGCRFIDTRLDRRGTNPVADLQLQNFYKKIIRDEKPDMVLTYTVKPNVYGGMACKELKVPYAMNVAGLGTAFEKNGILNKLVVGMYRNACQDAKVVFFENEEDRQQFIKRKIAREQQTHRLNGAGVNLETFRLTEYPNGDKIRFLFMGRIMAEKGIDELFAAMQKLTAEGVNCELDVLGGYEENYKDKIDRYEAEGWLHYRGYQKDVRPFIDQCHCFVLPSWHEGMANTNLESAASGRPVITSNIPGCREAVIDGASGLLTEPKNADDLYKVMKRFCMLSYEERKAMGLAGRKHMEEVFDKRQVVAETIKTIMG